MPIHSATEGSATDDRNSDDTYTTASHARPALNDIQSELTIQTSTSTDGNLDEKLNDDEPPRSVIHAPAGFRDFKLECQPYGRQSVPRSDTTPSVDSDMDSDMTMMKLPPVRLSTRGAKEATCSPISPPPLFTAVRPTKDWSERGTPRAQTMQEFQDVDATFHVNNTQVGGFSDGLKRNVKLAPDNEAEIRTLTAALAECWSLCNTLASLSSIHQKRLNCKGDVHEEAWKSCWKLCRELYNSQGIDCGSRVSSTLDICRSFCQTLFDARDCDNELADSVLRVSFELNNHLYNTHDRNLPDAFRERTLDFYITLCHRLMKQRSGTSDPESLLSACWSLAEMLFSIRQSHREGRVLDEELLGSAIQACWELCDIFREGWSRQGLRDSDRGTPRPSPAAYHQTVQIKEKAHSEARLNKSLRQQGNPETPTTIFEDIAAASPDDTPIQNIFVLGQDPAAWRSNSSIISGQTQSSEHSTNTITTSSNDLSLERLRVLMAKAAINCGYLRDGPQSLSSFIKSLSSDAFGSMAWQVSLLKNYKRMVAIDSSFREIGPQARAGAADIASTVQSTMQTGQFPWLRDLYRFVFGFHLEEAISRKGIVLQV
ncbi:hypothetical protein P170DRAFT_447197 [Aspergillus steynii IBT 23096]|uniref:DUF7624 domain-containing protein n=1 Tax=Aspergillus steynii IBT 23096 TaxID=1392250 RepID=A0A2I2G9J9_9EURO|nr:uncharacterized protein P170DRAFT_447197 [Aspergillus steynii IBT 23096]PLB49551.1 hypothetical protein P170DRAFT_447197 [Aspergillus steynii IBT 23096]